jgi:copper transport protein
MIWDISCFVHCLLTLLSHSFAILAIQCGHDISADVSLYRERGNDLSYWQKALRWGWISIFCLAVSAALPARSLAHAYIVAATPAANEKLMKAPKTIRIEFNENIQSTFYALVLVNQRGHEVRLHDVRIDATNPHVLEGNVPNRLADGTYVVKWKVVSSDGHPVEGTIPFQIGQSSDNGTLSDLERNGYFPKLDMIIIRGLFYIGVSLFLGLLSFKLFIYLPLGAWRFSIWDKVLYWAAYSLTALATLLSLPLQITVEADVSWFQALEGALVKKMMLHTVFGAIWMIQCVLLFLLFGAGYAATFRKKERHSKRWASFSFALGTSILFAKAWTGHAAASPHPLVACVMDFLHLFSASVWVGCLVIIAAILPFDIPGTGKSKYWEAVRRFSRWAAGLVAILMMTGIYAALQQIPTFDALFQTIYGKALLGKVLVLVVMLMLAAMNWISGRKQKNVLGAAVWSEFGLGIGAMLLAAMLTNLPPATASPGPFTQTKEAGSYQVTLHITPNVLGTNQFQIKIKNEKGRAVQDIEQVTVTLTSKEMDMGETTFQAFKVASGVYQTKETISMTGRWNVHVHILTTSLQSVDAAFACYVGSQ